MGEIDCKFQSVSGALQFIHAFGSTFRTIVELDHNLYCCQKKPQEIMVAWKHLKCTVIFQIES